MLLECFCVGHKACAFPFPILSFVAVNRVTYVHISRSCHHFHGVNSVLLVYVFQYDVQVVLRFK